MTFKKLTPLIIVALGLIAAFILVPYTTLSIPTEIPGLDTGNTAWMIVAMSFVFFMIPGLALFYGGMARRSSVLYTMMKSFLAIGFGGILWVIIGYTIAFGPTENPFIGSFTNFALNNIPVESLTSSGVPMFIFVLFQGMFAIIAVALISGAIIERTKFVSYVAFVVLWLLLVYAPSAHWTWDASGWLFKMGALDFAGGTIIHISAGVSAIVAALIIGPRVDKSENPHNIPFVLLGTGILWFGWFGFNAGSAGAANAVAGLAAVNTFAASAAAFTVWVMLDKVFNNKPSALGAAIGAVVGLVAITPAAGFVSPMASLIIGTAGASASFFTLRMKEHFPFDDALDVFACHGVGGIVGSILTGVFAFTTGSGEETLNQVFIQLVSIITVAAFAAVMTAIIMYTLKLIFGLRIKENDVDDFNYDVDRLVHGEKGYRK